MVLTSFSVRFFNLTENTEVLLTALNYIQMPSGHGGNFSTSLLQTAKLSDTWGKKET